MNVGQLIYLLMGIPRYFDVVIDGEGGDPVGVEMDTFNALAIIQAKDLAREPDEPAADGTSSPSEETGRG